MTQQSPASSQLDQPHSAGPRPRHLVPLGTGSWSLWRWVWLRGAGFAARPILELGSDAVFSQLEAERAAEDRVLHAQTAAMDACSAAAAAALDPLATQAMNNILGRLQARKLPARDTGNADVDRAIAAYRAARDELVVTRTRASEVVGSARAKTAAAILRISRDPRFREAVIWQNRAVLTNTLDRLLEAAPTADDSKTRERQRVVARYAQRYLLKNDSIGFFGPTGWGSVDPTAPGFAAMPGPALVEHRAVSFEDWAVEAVATQLSKDPEVRCVFTPRRRPTSWLEGTTLHVPPGAPRALTVAEAWLLARIDGDRSVGELADAAAADSTSGLASAGDAMSELERLGRENAITWGIEVPAELDHPERWLRERLARIADPEARARSHELLDRIDAARVRVADSAGDPAALEASVEALEDEFHAVTDLAPKRAHGRTYAGRQTFFEDCRRAVDLRVGRAVLDALDAPLTMILETARWFCYEVARRFRAGFDDAYDRALANGTARQVPLTAFLAAARGLFSPDHHNPGPIVAVVQAELQRRWGSVLGIDADPASRCLAVRADDCRALIADLFHAPGPGWPRARYHSPDVMIAAASVERIARGDFLAVLGELHPGNNTLLTHVAYRLHPERTALDEAYEADTAMPCISTIQREIGRVTCSPLAPRDHHVEIGSTRSWRLRDHVHLVGDLYVERAAGRLRVRSRVRDLDHDIVAFMEPYLGNEVAPHFKLLNGARHLPRVAIDKLVISRERWTLPPDEFRALTEEGGSPEDRVRRVATWARRLGMPRYVFATVPHEPKPFYVDFSSALYIDVFVRYLAEATRLRVTEMLPAHDELWLLDADGSSYTSELRFAAVDPRPWSAPGTVEECE